MNDDYIEDSRSFNYNNHSRWKNKLFTTLKCCIYAKDIKWKQKQKTNIENELEETWSPYLTMLKFWARLHLNPIGNRWRKVLYIRRGSRFVFSPKKRTTFYSNLSIPSCVVKAWFLNIFWCIYISNGISKI